MPAFSHSEADEQKSLGATVPSHQLLCQAGVCSPPHISAPVSMVQQITGMWATSCSKNGSFASWACFTCPFWLVKYLRAIKPLKAQPHVKGRVESGWCRFLEAAHMVWVCVCRELREGKSKSHRTWILQMSHFEGKHGNLQPFPSSQVKKWPQNDVGVLGKVYPPSLLPAATNSPARHDLAINI